MQSGIQSFDMDIWIDIYGFDKGVARSCKKFNPIATFIVDWM